MKNYKLFPLMIALLALTLILSACDGMTLEDLQSLNGVSNSSFDVNLKSSGALRNTDDSNLKSGNSVAQSAGSMTSESTSSDNMSADSIDDSSLNTLKVKGEVTAVTANSLTIGGVTYTFDTTEDLTTLFSIGDFIEVDYIINDDGSMTLYEFQFEDSMDDDSMDSPYVEVKAYITEVTANTITVNGQTFTVDTTEDLTTLLTAGELYQIKYILNTDGTITLLSFKLQSSMDDFMDDSYDDMYDDSNDDMYDNSSNDNYGNNSSNDYSNNDNDNNEDDGSNNSYSDDNS